MLAYKHTLKMARSHKVGKHKYMAYALLSE